MLFTNLAVLLSRYQTPSRGLSSTRSNATFRSTDQHQAIFYACSFKSANGCFNYSYEDIFPKITPPCSSWQHERETLAYVSKWHSYFVAPQGSKSHYFSQRHSHREQFRPGWANSKSGAGRFKRGKGCYWGLWWRQKVQFSWRIRDEPYEMRSM